jgi:heterotetrameric sarcosine oxidase delta subunit
MVLFHDHKRLRPRKSGAALRIPCPNCGLRPYTEFWFGGELRPLGSEADLEEDFRNVWLRENVSGVHTERWFHAAGCRRWLTIERDTVTNDLHGVR